MKAFLLILAVLFAAPAFADIQKCTMPDGKVVYSDSPCPNTSQQSRTVVKSQLTPPPVGVPLPEKVLFTGKAQMDYIKASALMDNIRVIGRDCEWALKVDKAKMQKCVDFMAKLQPGGEYAQVSYHISELNKDREIAAQSIGELRTISRNMTEIVRYKEFMLANLGVQSGK